MEMKVGSCNIRSSFSGGTPMIKSAAKAQKTDTAGTRSRDSFSIQGLAPGQAEQLRLFTGNLKSAAAAAHPAERAIRLDDYPARAEDSE